MTTVHRHLKALEREGYLSSSGTAVVRYRPVPRFAVDWTAPRGGKWFHRTWTHQGGLDGRFPLVTALPDHEAQAVVTAFLAAAWDHGLFQPWLKQRTLPPPVHGHTVVAYGSAARGDARDGSDVDVAVFVDGDAAHTAAFQELADELNLHGGRYLDLHVFHADAPPPPRLLAAIEREGVPVFSTGDLHG